MSWGLKRSEHSGQLMLTRLSEISIRRYCRRQSPHERWGHVMMSGKRSRAWRSRHSGHSRNSEEDEDVEVDATSCCSCCCWSCVSDWTTLSTLAMLSTPGRDLRDLGSGRRLRNSERREMPRFLGVFLTTEEEGRSRSGSSVEGLRLISAYGTLESGDEEDEDVEEGEDGEGGGDGVFRGEGRVSGHDGEATRTGSGKRAARRALESLGWTSPGSKK